MPDCPEFREALSREDWDELFKQAVYFAWGQTRRYKWRGAITGLMPDGYTVDAIVAQAFTLLFNDESKKKPDLWGPESLRNEIRRLVSNLIHDLNRRKETEIVLNDFDVLPPTGHGEPTSVLAETPGKTPKPDEAALKNEALAELESFKSQVREFLCGEKNLQDLFGCICDGIKKRSEIAEYLEVDVDSVTNARKRLKRRLEEFFEVHPEYPKIIVREAIALVKGSRHV